MRAAWVTGVARGLVAYRYRTAAVGLTGAGKDVPTTPPSRPVKRAKAPGSAPAGGAHMADLTTVAAPACGAVGKGVGLGVTVEVGAGSPGSLSMTTHL
jgi:hypothetical protein